MTKYQIYQSDVDNIQHVKNLLHLLPNENEIKREFEHCAVDGNLLVAIDMLMHMSKEVSKIAEFLQNILYEIRNGENGYTDD